VEEPAEEPHQPFLHGLSLTNMEDKMSALRTAGMESFNKMKEALAVAIARDPEAPEEIPPSAPTASSSTSSTSSHSYRNATVSGEKLSKAYCRSKGYAKLGFLPPEHKRLPPMLYTFPGSGNTWGRLLIEHATGVYTGSVYNDQSLLEALPGEFTCNWQVSAVKVHPHTHTFADLYSGRFHSDNNKCTRGGVMKFERAILLIRNPFDSIWSEYQRRVTQSHVEGILRKTFDWSRWQANAAHLSHKYNEMWREHYKGIEKRFTKENILYLRYEDLKNKATRVETLRSVAKFLRISLTNMKHIEAEIANNERFECAFVLAENTQAHRSVDEAIEMTKDVAYTKPLACRMFNLFGKYIMEHNYTSWKNFDCPVSEYPAIPNANVGPRGEYNRMWVQPGVNLLDFGGHEKSEFDPAIHGQRPGGGGRGRGRGGGAGAGPGGGAGKGGRGAGAGRGIKNLAAAGAAGAGAGAGAEPGAIPAALAASGNSNSNAAGNGARNDAASGNGGGSEGGSSGGRAGGGMTLQQATQLKGVGALGQSKPAWQ
jgi:hypothetical protein